MNIWIYKLSEPTLWDVKHYGERKFRYTMLAEALVEAGHKVLWWTDDFQHFRKEKGHRFGKDHHEQVSPNQTIRWITSPGYKHNISLRRFNDHKFVADKMLADSDNWPNPDLIIAGMPTDSMCELATKIGAKYNAPVVLDVRDHWPDIFFSQVPAIINPAVWLLTRAMQIRIQNSFSKATSITGNTDTFVDWGLNKGSRKRSELDHAFPIGYSKSNNNEYDHEAAKSFWQSFEVQEDDESFKICFLGAISKMYDFEMVLKVAQKLDSDQTPVKFILCGDGPDLERLKKTSKGLSNVILPGRIAKNEIHSLLRMSSVGIIPYINHDNFGNNIANKPAEYLSANLPILISVGGILTDLLEEYRCGDRYSCPKALVNNIRFLRDNPMVLKEQRKGASRLFAEKLNADKIYKEFAVHLDLVAHSFGNVD